MKMAHKAGGKLLLSAALSPGAVIAVTTFEQLDVNDDGQSSITDAGEDTRLTTTWSTADVDRDGVVSSVDFGAFERPQKKKQSISTRRPEKSQPVHRKGG